MDDDINVLHEGIEDTWGGEIPGYSHGEQIPVFFPTGFHLAGFNTGPTCPGDFDPALQEEVHDVGTHKACGTGDEDMAERRFVSGRCI